MKALIQKLKNLLPFFKKKAPIQTLEQTEEDNSEEQIPWWGTFLIDEEQSRFFKIGNIVLCLDRFHHKFHITTYREGEQPFKTFAAQSSNEIILKPTLPNRSLLTYLDRPFYIPSGESLLLYMSSPIWIQIEAGKPPILLDEIATETLADTWFGENTLEGELCFAGQTFCSPRLEDLPRDTTRMISPILFVNRSKEALVLQELKIPLPSLSVYSDNQNYLWTEQLNIYQEDHNYPEVTILKGAPQLAKEPKLISVARHTVKSGLKDLLSPFMWK